MKIKLLNALVLLFCVYSIFAHGKLPPNIKAVAETYTNIPDPVFENILISYGYDSGTPDGKVLTSRINTIKSLVLVGNMGAFIHDLTGIEDFIALQTLECSNNKIVTLDLSKNINLTSLDCSENLISSLNLSGCKKLKTLSAGTNRLANIDITSNIALDVVILATNILSTIDITKNTVLTDLTIANNNLTTIDVSKNTKLKRLDCSRNKITSLNITRNTYYSLHCHYNKLTSLDVSKLTGLTYLDCSNNQISNLDLTKNTKIEKFFCNNNQLVSLNLKNGSNKGQNILRYINFTSNPNLSCIKVDDTNYSNQSTAWIEAKDATATFDTECNVTEPTVFNLPANNFSIETKGENCINSNNGELSIKAVANYPYTIKINNKAYDFVDNQLKVTNLAPGTYTITITIPAENYIQNYSAVITSGVAISAAATTANKLITLKINQGTAPFAVSLDGIEQFETSTPEFSINAKGGELLEVKTAKACEGVYTQVIENNQNTITAFPNPTEDYFEITLSTFKNKDIYIGIYSLSGQLISKKQYTINNEKALVNLSEQPKGLYIVKAELDKPKYIKILKK